MIAVDTSALMAVLLREHGADAVAAVLEAEDHLLMSAATMAEALIVAERRNLGIEMTQLLDGLDFEIVAVTSADAGRVAETYRQWGKGMHPASLNFGDCFAYIVAKQHDCRLLYVGNDFRQTDIDSVL